MEGWSGNNIWSRVVSWDDWTPSWIQSSKEATCKQCFCCRFSPATISKLSKTLHYTNPVWWLGLTGYQKTFKFATTPEKMFTKMATEIEVEFRQALLNLGPGFASNISHSNHPIEAWRIHHRFGSCSRWIHRSQGVRRWPGNIWDSHSAALATENLTIMISPGKFVKYCDSEPLILISLRWNFMFGVTVSNATFTEPLKQAKVTVPLEERWQTAQLHALADSAPPGWEIESVPGSGCTKYYLLRLNQTLATWILGPHMFSESKVKISFVYVLIIYHISVSKTCICIYI